MATLLCSMLIGAGFPAMVVSGSAKPNTVNNDQRNVEYPLPSGQLDNDEEIDEIDRYPVSPKYTLKPKPDLKSYLTENLEQSRQEKEMREKNERDEDARIKRDALEDETSFKDPYRLTHAWVMIVDNAPWTIKPRVKTLDEEGEEIDVPPTVKFIEPSTGAQHDVSTSAYVHVESVWNNLNYYVNLQTCRIREMNWDLRVTSDWEHMLAGEPIEMRELEETSDENLAEEIHKITVEKHLDIGQSWVQKLEIGQKEFLERFPNHHKAIHYKKVLYERYSSHKELDGKIEQVTQFSDDKYEVPVMRWVFFNNRVDLMTKLMFDYSTGQTIESFLMGRPDSLRHVIFNADEKQPRIMHFYSSPRCDVLRYCEVTKDKVILSFEKIPGKCFYKEFKAKYDRVLLEITEKFQRDPNKSANHDIAIRQFLLTDNKIILKFHYVRGALTARIREFTKPPKPDYGQEIPYSPELSVGYQFGGDETDLTELEIYLLLLEQLKAEKSSKKAFYKHIAEIEGIFDARRRERLNTILTFNCYDPLRNTDARRLRVEKDAMEAAELKERHENPPDFLAPYLVPYSGRTLTHKESLAAYHACLNDLKKRFVSLLNELQRRYEDLTAEALSLKKFLNKFQNKFDDFDYERLLKESKDLELNKRMVQKRLTITHEEAQKKYDAVKHSLLNDKRLNLKLNKDSFE